MDEVALDVEAEDVACAFSTASSGVSASLTPPALPRPPVLTWALTTTGLPMRSATPRAASAVSTVSPGEHGDAVLGEELLRLVLHEVHEVVLSARLTLSREANDRRRPPTGADARCDRRHRALRRWGGLADVLAHPLDDRHRRGAGREDLRDAERLELRDVVLGDDPAAEDDDVVGAALAQQLHHPGEQRHVGAGQHRQADAVGVLLDRRLDDLLRASGAGRCRRPPCPRRAAPARRPWRRGRARRGRAWRRRRGSGRRRWSRGLLQGGRATVAVGEYAPVTAPAWQARCSQGAVPVEVPRPAATRRPGPATCRARRSRVLRLPTAVAAVWDFSAYGGSFGEDDATALVAAADLARRERRAAAHGRPVAAAPGCRRAWRRWSASRAPGSRCTRSAGAGCRTCRSPTRRPPAACGSRSVSGADLRVAVDGRDGRLRRAAGRRGGDRDGAAAGQPHRRVGVRGRAASTRCCPPTTCPAGSRPSLRALTPDPRRPGARRRPVAGRGRLGAGAALARPRPSGGAELLALLLDDAVALRAPRGDETVAAVLGRAAGRPAVGRRAGRPAGRAADAGRLPPRGPGVPARRPARPAGAVAGRHPRRRAGHRVRGRRHRPGDGRRDGRPAAPAAAPRSRSSTARAAPGGALAAAVTDVCSLTPTAGSPRSRPRGPRRRCAARRGVRRPAAPHPRRPARPRRGRRARGRPADALVAPGAQPGGTARAARRPRARSSRRAGTADAPLTRHPPARGAMSWPGRPPSCQRR